MSIAVIPSTRIPFSMSRDYAHSSILFPVGEREVAWIGRDGTPFAVNGSKAVVRLTPDGRSAVALAIVSRTYKLVHNRELFNIVADTMEQVFDNHELDDAYCIDKLSQLGRTCWREYVFPSVTRRIGNTDVGMRIIVQNGYGGSALKLYAGAIDFFCTNGMVRGEFETWYKRHTSGLVVGSIEQRINDAAAMFIEGANEWRRWAETPVTREQTMEFFRAIATTGRQFESLSTQWVDEIESRGRNLWSVYSAMTYYSSHADAADATKRDGIMHRRELRVAKWVQSEEWRKLETAA